MSEPNWYFVWTKHHGVLSPQLWSKQANPHSPGVDAKAYGPEIVSIHDVPPEQEYRVFDLNALDQFAEIFPAPTGDAS